MKWNHKVECRDRDNLIKKNYLNLDRGTGKVEFNGG